MATTFNGSLQEVDLTSRQIFVEAPNLRGDQTNVVCTQLSTFQTIQRVQIWHFLALGDHKDADLADRIWQ